MQLSCHAEILRQLTQMHFAQEIIFNTGKIVRHLSMKYHMYLITVTSLPISNDNEASKIESVYISNNLKLECVHKISPFNKQITHDLGFPIKPYLTNYH